jgi:uncharacterized repeat protein (TIGR03803 family)
MKHIDIFGRFGFLVFWIAALAILVNTAHAQCTRCCGGCPSAPPPDILYGFAGGPDGALPVAGLVRDSIGNLYGTTEVGGTTGNGTVFKVDATGHETVLHSFSGPDGSTPISSLILDSNGNLYGTTIGGGAHGQGTVFKVDVSGNYTVLYSFAGGNDGANPWAALVQDSAGNLYGTTNQGGTADAGTVFKVDPSRNETVLYSFQGSPSGGANPEAGLVRDSAGNLYGTAIGGTSQVGLVFKVDPSGNETVLYNFKGYPDDGAYPQSSLIRDAAGNLYGMTSAGGSGNCVSSSNQPIGCGVVFKLNSTGNETVLYSFPDGGFANGYSPGRVGALLQDTAGLLYGTRQRGGASDAGLIFQLDTAGHEADLYSFTAKNGDGGYPEASLILDDASSLLGTTMEGGAFGAGTVFRLPVPDFSLAPGSDKLSLQFGGQQTDVVTIALQNAPFNNPVQLTCSVSGPTPLARCAMNPTSVTPGNGSVTSTLTVTAPSVAVAAARHFAPSSYAMWFPLAAFALMLPGGKKKRRVRYWLPCGFVALLMMLPACGSVGPGRKGPSNYTVTVTAAAGPTQHTTQVSVTVQ